MVPYRKLNGEKGVSPFAPICFGTDLAQMWHKEKGSDVEVTPLFSLCHICAMLAPKRMVIYRKSRNVQKGAKVCLSLICAISTVIVRVMENGESGF